MDIFKVFWIQSMDFIGEGLGFLSSSLHVTFFNLYFRFKIFSNQSALESLAVSE